MIESLKQLIEALRKELQDYGEMLARLDRQQEQVTARAAGEVMESVTLIHEQTSAIQGSRAHREKCRRQVSEAIGVADDSSFRTLIPMLPQDYRPLVKALVEENNELLVRVQQRARQNHLLLSRSLELMQGFLNTLFPAHETLVYNDHGNHRSQSIRFSPLYEAVG